MAAARAFSVVIAGSVFRRRRPGSPMPAAPACLTAAPTSSAEIPLRSGRE